MAWEVPEILDRMHQVDDVCFDRVSQIHLPRWSDGRVALIGDAAACASLLAGEGTGLAMIEAYVLAGELHRASRQNEQRKHEFTVLPNETFSRPPTAGPARRARCSVALRIHSASGTTPKTAAANVQSEWEPVR